jgi:hypothetical protein
MTKTKQIKLTKKEAEQIRERCERSEVGELK